MYGYQRRKNGQGKRPGDTVVRISADVRALIEDLKSRDGVYGLMSINEIFRDLLERELLGQVVRGGRPAPAGKLTGKKKVATPSRC